MEESKSILTINRQKNDLLNRQIAGINSFINSDESLYDKIAVEGLVDILSKWFSVDFLSSMTASEMYRFIISRFEFIEKSVNESLSVSVSPAYPDATEKNKQSIVLELLVKDRPFIIDSLTEYLHELKYDLSLILFPVLELACSEEKRVVSITNGTEDSKSGFTYVCCVIDNFVFAEQEILKNDVLSLLEMVENVTDDFALVSESIEEYTIKKDKSSSESLIDSERRQMFAWFNSGNVILLGSGEVAKEDLSPDLTWDKIKKPLGYVRRKKQLNDPLLPKEIGRFGKFFMESGLKINLIETSVISEVHKKDRIQVLFGRRKEEDGSTRINFFQILFTNKSNKEEALAIPLARLKVNSILELEHTGEKQGHWLKTANDFFSMIPKSELFRLDRAELKAIFDQFLYFGDYQQTKVCTFTQPERNYARVTFCLPHHKFSPNIFEKIDEILAKKFDCKSEIKYWFNLGRNSYSHHIFWFPNDFAELSEADMQAVEEDVAGLTMSWEDEYQTALNNLEPQKSDLNKNRYYNVFGIFFQAVFSPKDALKDIEFLEELLTSGRDQVDLRSEKEKDESIVYIYSKKRYHLTKSMPHFQNLALVVIDENTYSLTIDSEKVYIYTYYVKSLKKQEEEFEGFHLKFCDLLCAVLENRTEDDVLNGLLMMSGLSRSEINLFILYRNYYWQIGAPYLPINKSFLENKSVITALRDYFISKFDPEKNKVPLDHKELEALKDKTFKVIQGVKTVAEDIIFKTILNLMEATLRTNYFFIDEHSTLAVKIKSADVEHMPIPRPLYEIYVHGTDVEGIHLRGAMIARGGLRYSDRHSDFRTEVLGLMNTQMLKNVVIVPEGSKGGFITKKHFKDRKEQAEDVITQYKMYINSLLSLTDNIVDGQTVPAKGIVRYDEDDPYLVVAADKGTATFSDTANEISASRNFWMGDAFASGGQHGYDHKGMAITARGAWESVKHHFLEVGKDIQNTDFTVIGIGDMSGDVFGNGMLLSKHIRLIGAFNHLHIFIDPEPDAAATWTERERIFKLPGSTWMDFDTSLISQGGGIFERSAKTINLTPEIKKALGVSVDSASGEELIKFLLLCQVDMLWNGGIGTYVKSSTETSSEVGDAANDAVRVDANQVKAKVIGEGGNLGLTQLARLEASEKGLKLNTDAIDNSGGVDTSDHEVNLKILMSSLISQGQIKSQEERNQLLEDLTDDIADLVLVDNKGQVQVISMDSIRSKGDMKPFLDLIRILSERKLMDPRAENMSTIEELTKCTAKGTGMPRPDLAILLSYTKMFYFKEILKSKTLDDPFLENVYYSYFPETFREKYDITTIQHPLKKEIIGTALVNRMVNQAGTTLLPEIFSILDTNVVDVLVGYTVLDQIFNLGEIRCRIMTELKTKNINTAYTLKIKLEKFIRDVLIWMIISYNSSGLKFSLANDFISSVTEFKKEIETTMYPDELDQFQNTVENLMTFGISSELANDIARLDNMNDCLEIILQAMKGNISLENAISLAKGMDSMFHFQVLYNRIMGLKLESMWMRKHRGILLRQLQSLKQKAFITIVERYKFEEDFDDKLAQFMEQNKQGFKKYQIDFNQIVNAEFIELSGVAILLNNIDVLLK